MVQDDTIKRDKKPSTGNDRTINLGSGEGVKQARSYNIRLEAKTLTSTQNGQKPQHEAFSLSIF